MEIVDEHTHTLHLSEGDTIPSRDANISYVVRTRDLQPPS